MIALLEEEVEMAMFRDYIGESLWDISAAIKAFGKVENEMPHYTEFSHPERREKKQTAAEIKAHILDRLRE